uniref:Junctional adhesion molecule 3a n=1 Tax=Kryptolebias marmoratus TaxID=37003 RepID=A0A3Q3AP43_KRYMA
MFDTKKGLDLAPVLVLTFIGTQLESACCHVPSSLGVILRTTDKIVWANEFEPIELTCLIESISTNNPRIEWKKIKNGIPSYVYFQNKISGDLENRAQLREPANILIFNTTRKDTAEYRCEVAAIEDQRDFDEILISLAVRVKPVVPRCSIPESVTVGTSTELRCLENEGFPAPQYRWFHNNEELPQDPKNSPKYANFSYAINPDTGSLKFRRVRKDDAGEYYCQAKNDAGHAQCHPQTMEVCNYNWSPRNGAVDYGEADEVDKTYSVCSTPYFVLMSQLLTFVVLTSVCFFFSQGHFRHKSSFVI